MIRAAKVALARQRLQKWRLFEGRGGPDFEKPATLRQARAQLSLLSINTNNIYNIIHM